MNLRSMNARMNRCLSEKRYIKKDSEVSIEEAARGIPRGPGVSIGVVPRPPQRARRLMVLLAVIRDSRCGSMASRGMH